jgi:hypothetical protein
MKTVKGVLLNAGVGASAESVEVSDLESIQGYVGGLIDAVRQPINDDLYVIGYVHDEGLVLDLEMNWLASALFMKEIRGNVVLVNGNNEVGEYDGHNHDLPEPFIEWIQTNFVRKVAETYNESLMLSVMVGFAVDNKLIDREEIQKFFDDTNSYSSGHEITEEEMKTLSDFINNVMTKCEELISSNIGDTMAEEIYEYLKGEGK